MTGRRGIRGTLVGFRHDPFLGDPATALEVVEDALVVVEAGHVLAVGPHDAERPRHPAGMRVDHHPGGLLTAGFIDAHVHYPQTGMIGAHGAQLLDWLDRYTFPAEMRLADPAEAARVAAAFLREVLRAGTTTAMVYCTVHAHSVDAFFAEAERYGARMIAGKVMMDRNAPPALLDTPEAAERDVRDLIAHWHGRGRLLYAVTPRFAPACSPEELALAGRLWREHPGTYMQTHVSENEAEVAWVRELFPESDGYLDVYHRTGLTGPRAVFGHGVHLTEAELCLCHRTGSAIAHCPTSNSFLGSGLFRLADAKRADRPVRVALGTDVGAGTSLSQLRTLGEAYKVAQLRGTGLTAAQALWLATAGGAEALCLADRIGRVAPGMEADLVVLDPAATPLLEFRDARAAGVEERLFVMMTLGDERCVRQSWVAGRPVYDRDAAVPFDVP